jgi:hypothetical protein
VRGAPQGELYPPAAAVPPRYLGLRLALPGSVIHPSAQNKNSAKLNFALTEFSEVRHT